ncbi:hypothetical protein PCANC_27413 [Puccinia coronata f. sp. avenae]|uniref:Uncharacterized protein n=2 Tax=Puccinia coronata f. sp. avenae TaxID=200324 RepID=A0A2N5TBG9_9BASI|nr:hypothetical protein PCANC_27413 [Puccinia coronata f. sp. avenae]PLW36012.1 hypothetical protein PCASD_13795 [Puccinia coronata f. sp. avenae]
MELHVLGSRWSRQLIMAALTTPCVVPTLPLLINAQGADSSDDQRAAFDQRVPSSIYSSPAPSSNTISTSSSLTSTNFPSSAPSSSAASTPTNSSSSAAHPSNSSNPVITDSSAPASTNKTGTSSSNDRHTPYLRAGLKPEVLMGVVLATCFGLLFITLGTLFVYTRYLRPKLQSKQKQKPTPDATEFSESEVDTPAAEMSDRGASAHAAERAPISA